MCVHVWRAYACVYVCVHVWGVYACVCVHVGSCTCVCMHVGYMHVGGICTCVCACMGDIDTAFAVKAVILFKRVHDIQRRVLT